jgi:hypothetical protein
MTRLECFAHRCIIGERYRKQSLRAIIAQIRRQFGCVHRDVTLRLAPVDLAMAQEMIDEVRGLKPISGFRGLPRGDLDALAAAIVAVSRLAALPGLAEAEINPLIIHRAGEGVTVADAWVTRSPCR